MNRKQKAQLETAVVIAKSPVLRESARKIRTTVKTIATMSPHDAIAALQFFPNRPAIALRKTLRQAVANATNNLKLAETALSGMNIQIEAGSTMKRFRIGGRGQVKPVLKRTSRIVVRLYSAEQRTENREQKEKGKE